MHAGLAVKVSLYDPDVECVSDPKYDDEAACSNLIGTLHTNSFSYLFTHDIQSSERKVVIPRKESGMRRRSIKSLYIWHLVLILVPKHVQENVL